MTIVLAPALGPTLGGWITDNSTWRWVFFINIPVGLPLALLKGFSLDKSDQVHSLFGWWSGIMKRIITREELKEKLNQRREFKLINCLDEWMFREKRIPGSIRFERHLLKTLNPEEEIIVYCSNPGCTASVLVYQQFVEHGFQNVWHYPGGIADWEDGGYQFESEHFQRKQ